MSHGKRGLPLPTFDIIDPENITKPSEAIFFLRL